MRQNGSPLGTPVTTTVSTSSPTHNTLEPATAAATAPSMVTANDTTNIPPLASSSLSAPCLPAARESPGNTPPTSSPAPSPHLSFQANDQLLRVLTERSGHWFSLLPRNPCDLSSLTTTPSGVPRVSPQASSTPARPRSPPPSPALPLTPSAASASASPHHPTGILSYPLSTLQVRILAGKHVAIIFPFVHYHLPHPSIVPLFSTGEVRWLFARSFFRKLAQWNDKSQPASVQQP